MFCPITFRPAGVAVFSINAVGSKIDVYRHLYAARIISKTSKRFISEWNNTR